ncbi:MAG: site-specific DNA-methyltransferase [Candidatus Aenigmarchaeota archaeon]|nr:site-specific DNA-methyltransferase [Candidatus Aenigmarchaeota archaeon]MDW8149383.1 site-specific DNA-methyltransferase [Candidatus Aenigmarchaeota archaeon]
MTKEQKFFNALRDIFIGAKVEGTGGFINLMKIKSKYYEKIEQLLKEDIDNALGKYPNFREELFDKLYTFFKRYFTESGSIYFNSTPFHNNIYERIYTDDRDVILFWKTKMLYYVKTDRIFRSMPIEFEGKKFFFDASEVENKKSNEKRELIYKFEKISEDNTIQFKVLYSEKGRKTKIEEILREIKKAELNITEEDIERSIRIFERQSEVDYFINKNAKAFLKEQFDLWLYQYVTDPEVEWNIERIEQIQILKRIAYKLIDFISQFEDELVKIWNKPKFVKNSNYVITLDRIAKKGGWHIIEKLVKHNGWQEQVKEWIKLKIITDKPDKIIEEKITGKELNKSYQFLPIDTKYFKDLEIEILELFDNLDNELDGWLIKSENYQALNTILPKFKGKIQTIYIDPPFNKEQNADYLYNVKYKDSTWASMLENRLRLAKDLLNDRGSIFVRCDYNGNWIVRPLMDEVFGRENFRNEIIIRRGAPKSAMFEQFGGIKSLGVMYDNLFWYSSTPDTRYQGFKVPTQRKGGYWSNFYDMKPSGERPTMRYELFGLLPPKNYYWKWSKERALKAVENYKKYEENKKDGETIEEYSARTQIRDFVKFENGKVKYWVPTREEDFLDNKWFDITGFSSNWKFKTENSESLLKRIIQSTSNEGDLVMDFFLGSGTTTAVAHKLKRKWIGVEMGEHFRDVVLIRMKKVLAYDNLGISKEKDVEEKYNENKAGGFFKYYELEQYEETLANTIYEDCGVSSEDIFTFKSKTLYEQYAFMKDEKMLKTLEIDYENNKIKVDLNKIYENIDIAETLSNLTGKWIKQIKDGKVIFEDGSVVDTKSLDYKLIKPLIWWE